MKQNWIIGVVAVIIILGLWYVSTSVGGSGAAGSQATTTAQGVVVNASGNATSTGGGTFVPTSRVRLTTAGVAVIIVGGQWSSANPAAEFMFSANGVLEGKLGTATLTSGSWQLYTAADAPSDLQGLSLDPDGVFLRLVLDKKHEDFLVNAAATSTLAIGPLGQPGLITLTR